jgi:hypothetical protein
MLKLETGKLIESFGCLNSFCQTIKDDRHFDRPIVIDANTWNHVHGAAARIKEQAEAFNLPVTLKCSNRVIEYLGQSPDAPYQLDAQAVAMIIGGIEGISNGLQAELDVKFCFIIPGAVQRYYAPDQPLFGQDVEDKFSASHDIEEAGKCLALGRYTACVFHLMRSAEAAVGTLTNAIGATVKNDKDETLPWGILLSNMKGKIDAMPKGEGQDAWLKVHALLHSCNRAYRTKTAHPAHIYTEEHAENAMHATRSFMQEMATLI